MCERIDYMLAASQSIKYNIDNDGKFIGKLKVSKFIKSINKYKLPFSDTKKLEVIKIGIGDYDDFDNFIISSLTDYYKKLSSPSDVESKEDMLETYSNLYSLWEQICKEKAQNNYDELSDLYNKISYGLYILGYSDNQL